MCWRVNIDRVRERDFDLDIKNPNKTEDIHEHSSQEIIGLLKQSLDKSHSLIRSLEEVANL
jgi:type I restriction enzyme M protein